MSNPIALAADWFSQSQEFCGFWLAQYCVREGYDLERLASFLGCTVEQLHHIRICRFPRPERGDADVTEIAARGECNPARLSRALVVEDWNGEHL